MKKSILLSILTLAMVGLLWLPNSTQVYAETKSVDDGNFSTLQTAISNASDGDTIEITAPISVTAVININKDLTFTASDSGKLTRGSSFTNDFMFRIKNGIATFKDIIIDGGNVSADYGGIRVDENCELVFENGAVLQNCNSSCSLYYGGGINLDSSSTFTMHGGVIQGNYSRLYGGGVFLNNGSSFIITGGSIINNKVGNTGLGGGIEIGFGCTVKLSGDIEINGNKKQDGRADNIYMEARNTLELTGALTNTTPIGVRMGGAGVFTKGTAVDNSTYINQFTTDDSNYTVQAEGSQLKLVELVYPITITVNKDDAVWNAHGKSFKLVKSGTNYTDLTSIPDGTYDIYEGTTDTGVNVTVNGAGASATVDYYTVTLAGGAGITSTNGGGTYLKGSSPTISAAVSTGYTWSKWTQTTGGADLSATNNYTITNIQSARSYTATAVDSDIAVIEDAKTAAEDASYSNMTQVAATSETVIADALKATAVAAVDNPDVTISIDMVRYTAPSEGNIANPAGTNGSYIFTITVSKGTQSQTTTQKTITITATPYNGITDGEAVAAAKAAIVDGSVNVAFGSDQAAKTAAVQAYVNGILGGTADAAGVTATVTFNSGTGKYDVALNKGSENDSKHLTMTVNVAPDHSGGPQTPEIITQPNIDIKTITVIEAPQNIPEARLLTVEPVGEAFDDSVEARLKEDTNTEDMIRSAMESASSALGAENAQIFPMDISLYLKGTDTKVQPKEGTSVRITCPVPTELLTGKDKLVVVCVIDGKLQVLPTTLIMKDGVFCAQFTATHFSPYAFVIDDDNKLAEYVTGTLANDVTNINTKLTAVAGTLTKVELEGMKQGSAITYHVCTPTLISIDSNGSLFAKKAGSAVLMAKVSDGDATTLYTIRITVQQAKGGTKVGFIKNYEDILTYHKINYRITTKATDKAEGTVAVANNQINTNLPKQVIIPSVITFQGKTYRVTSIDESAFYNLNKITSVTIPAGIKEISSTAFVSCDNLRTFKVSSDNKYYSAKKGMLLNKKGTTLIAYPSAKGTIVIDKKIAVIGDYAFSACKYLTGVVIPTTVTRIDGCAFAHSKALAKVDFMSESVPEIPYPCIFDKVKETCTILVPENSLPKYQAALKNARMPKGVSLKGE